MMLLPKDMGPFTLVRKIGTGAVAESYLGTLHDGESRPVVVRRILPYILRDPPRLASLEARVRDLMGVRHPFLVQILDWVEDGQERFIVEARVDGVDLDKVLSWCRTNQTPLPHNVFLNLSTQVCNGLEALHGRPGRGTGADNVLHLGLRPGAILVTREGKVVLGGFGLTRSPTSLSHGGVSSPVPSRMEYLSPEQTQPDQKLTPASDIFALGSILYELLTLDPLFRSDSNLQTINRVRKAEVTAQLLRVKELMPGLDKVLYRALSLNPRHRYQRAFVLREDLRGLMAGYSFSSIVEDTQNFFGPMLSDQAEPAAVTPPPPAVPQAAAAPAAAAQAAEPQGDEAEQSDPDATVVGGSAAADLAVEMATADRQAQEALAAAEAGPGTAQQEHDEDDQDLAGAAVVAGPGAAAPPLVPAAPQLGAVDEFSDEVATRIEQDPASTAALAAEAVRAHFDESDSTVEASGSADVDGPQTEEGTVETEAEGTAETEHAAGLPVDELPAPQQAQADSEEEDLADRSTLPLPPGSAGLEDDTDIAAAAAIAAGVGAANSTRAFLGKDDIPAEPAAPPPTTAPDPSSSGIGDRLSTRAPAPPPVPGLSQPSAPPPAVPGPAAPRAEAQPAGSGPTAVPAPTADPPSAPPAAARPASGIAARAPRPQPEVLPPTVSDRTTTDSGDGADEDLDYKPRRSGMMLGVAALVAVLIVACGLGSYTLTRMAGDAAEDAADAALAGLEAAEPEPEPLEGVADAEELEGAASEAAASEAAAPEAAAPEAAAPEAATERASAAPAQPAAAPVAARSTPRSSSSSSSRGSSSSSSRGSSASSGSSSGSSWSSSRSSAEEDALADLSLEDEEPMEGEPVRIEDIEQYASPASSGRLSSSDVMALEMVELQDPAYTRSRALLVMNAQRKEDEAGAKRYLDQLMRLPENQYNPIYLSDLGRYYVNKKQYERALQQAELAERYWARLPPELVFTKKAEIYETQAAAWQGRFYQSGDDMEMLDQAIRHWQKYRDHVQTKSRADLARRAEAELSKLEDIRTRLQ